MRFDTSQHMKLGQQMKLAPRMIQSMEILQMPLAALEERIEQELENNVTLETFEPGGDREELELQRKELEREARERERPLNVEENGSAADFERLDSYESENADALDNEYSASDARPEPEYLPGSYSAARMAGERDGKLDAMANTEARAISLTEQLREQWAFSDVDDELRAPGNLLISHIDDDGYIRAPLDQIIDQAPPAERPPKDQFERALLAVQLFLDPPGIGARDVRECLLLQVDALADEAVRDHTLASPDDIAKARILIEHYLDDLVHNRIPKIASRTGWSVQQIKSAMEWMRRLSLHPARRLISENQPTIIPDAIVEYDDDSDSYIAYLTDGRLPNLRLNREYARMARDRAVPKSDREFVRTNLSNAQWLIDAIQQRRQTLLRVIQVVVAAQRDFFDLGPQALKPLPMTLVAEQLGIHVATVSRAVAGKYLQTPRGIFPLRKFFTGGTQTDTGEDISWETIKAAMQDVVTAEDKAKPLSDDAIVDELKKRGIEIARRTVAKYRGQLDIPPARLRRQY